MKRLGEIKVKKHEVQTDEEMKRMVWIPIAVNFCLYFLCRLALP